MGKTANKAAFRRKVIEGEIQTTVAALFQLSAKNGVASSYLGAASALPSHLQPAADYDGMLGSVMIESFLAEAFSTAVNDNNHAPAATTLQNIKYNEFVDLLDIFREYLKDREDNKGAIEKGRGSFALGEHKSLCNIFKAVDAQTPQPSNAEQSNLESALQALLAQYHCLDRISSSDLEAPLKI